MRTNRDQRVWDGIYAAAWAGLVIRHSDPSKTLSNEELANMASDARNIADRGLAELCDCQFCGGAGESVDSEELPVKGTCYFCAGTGRRQ